MVRAIKKHPSLFSLVLVLAALPLLWKGSWWKSSWLTLVSASAPVEAPSGFASTVIRAGLGPVELAAAGLTDAQAAAVVGRVLVAWNAAPNALPAAQAAFVAAKQDKQRLERLVRSGRASPEDVAAYGQAVEALAVADTVRAAALEALFDAGVADLTDSQVATLVTIRGNSGLLVPIQYRVADRTEAEWLALENALANEQIAGAYDETPASDCVAHLATVRSDSDVAAATAACDANGAAIRTAWNAAVAR